MTEETQETAQPEPGQMVTAEGELEPTPVAAEPTEAPPEPESLAEQVYRESHTVPESTTPSDVVPNRPNIRPPGTEEVVEEAPPEPEVEAAAAEDEEEEHESAKELIADAETAEDTAELDRIEALAEGRVTVLNAVMERRAVLRGR